MRIIINKTIASHLTQTYPPKPAITVLGSSVLAVGLFSSFLTGSGLSSTGFSTDFSTGSSTFFSGSLKREAVAVEATVSTVLSDFSSSVGSFILTGSSGFSGSLLISLIKLSQSE